VFTFCLYDFSPFGPAWQNKLRPVVYYDQYPTEDRRQGNNRNSFYGGHVANAAAASFSAAKILNDYHPEFSSGTKYMLYGAATLPPMAVAYLRTRALKHFPSDNLVGMLIGGACGVIVPELHRIKKQGIEFRTEATPAGPGIGMTWRWDERRAGN
jgi:membrane-associated phospholipid phosphatase